MIKIIFFLINNDTWEIKIMNISNKAIYQLSGTLIFYKFPII